ncbi:hypothetical protein ABZ470_39595 [Streptosporangium sp. NPDC020072]|uniref:hypothetical protein n=1 Tax=Streptosporangium sp. NPDC020072 TaxID=3154788 RepID=UPI00344A54B9
MADWEYELLGLPVPPEVAERSRLVAELNARSMAEAPQERPVVRLSLSGPPVRVQGGELLRPLSGAPVVVNDLEIGLRGDIGAAHRHLNLPDWRSDYFKRVLYTAGLRSRRRDGHGYVVVTDEGYTLVAPVNDNHDPRYLLYAGTNKDMIDWEKGFAPLYDEEKYVYVPEEDRDGASLERGWGPGWNWD